MPKGHVHVLQLRQSRLFRAGFLHRVQICHTGHRHAGTSRRGERGRLRETTEDR